MTAAACYLGLWVRIPLKARKFVSVSVVCCQLEVSALGWSLVQRSAAECGVSDGFVILHGYYILVCSASHDSTLCKSQYASKQLNDFTFMNK